MVLARQALADLGEVVHTDDHVLRGDVDRLAGCRRAQVVRREHEHAGLDLSLAGQRHVDRHLVAVEVGVEGRADQRMQVDSLALDQHRLKGLDGQTVQGRCTVEQHDAAVDDLFGMSHTKVAPRSIARLAPLMFSTLPSSTRRFMTKGLKSSSAMVLGKPHWCSSSLGSVTITKRPE